MNPDLYDEIFDDANKRYRAWTLRGGVRGQVILPQDGFDYWVALVAYEKGKQEINAP